MLPFKYDKANARWPMRWFTNLTRMVSVRTPADIDVNTSVNITLHLHPKDFSEDSQYSHKILLKNL